MSWQPIETAPRNTAVLCFWPLPYRERSMRCAVAIKRGTEWADPEDSGCFIKPAHWMPLPEPPHVL